MCQWIKRLGLVLFLTGSDCHCKTVLQHFCTQIISDVYVQCSRLKTSRPVPQGGLVGYWVLPTPLGQRTIHLSRRPSKPVCASKHLKGQLGPRVGDVTFFNHGGQLGPCVGDVTFFNHGGQLGTCVGDVTFFNQWRSVGTLRW